MDGSEREWRALQSQVIKVDSKNKSNRKEFQMVMNTIEEAIIGNNCKFAKDYETTHAQIDHYYNNNSILKGRIEELEGTDCLQKSTINCCLDKVASLGETVVTLVLVVTKLKSSVCCCHDCLLLPGPHYTKGEQGEVVVNLEEDDLEYETEEDPSNPSYISPPNTRGHTPPSPHLLHSPTPEDSDPENNASLQTVLLKACVEAFLAKVDEDLELADLPPLENVTPIPIQAPIIPGFISFAVSTGQCCVPSKGLPQVTFHPYNKSVGQYHCEPGRWCNDLPCSGQEQQVSQNVRGHGSVHGGSRSG